MKRIPATAEDNHKGWGYIPLVRIGNILRRMIWFSGSYSLHSDESDYERFLDVPENAQLEMQYRKQTIIIKCNWEVEKENYFPHHHKYPDRFAIGIEEPHHPNFQISRWRVPDQIKYKYTRFYSVAIDKIEDAIYDAQEVIDEEIAEEERKQKRETELEIIKKKLCKNLDVSITNERYNQSVFAYREYNDYHLNFHLSDNDNTDELFEINQIGGKYTENEIKKIIEIVGGNPRAIAERLTN